MIIYERDCLTFLYLHWLSQCVCCSAKAKMVYWVSQDTYTIVEMLKGSPNTNLSNKESTDI